MPSRLRVLVVAELCNPEWASGPLVGWHHTSALSRHVDIELVTHKMNRPAVEKVWPKDRVTFIGLGRYAQVKDLITDKLLKVEQSSQMFTLLGIPLYWRFEQLIWQIYGERIKRGEFDVVHRITPVSPVVSSPLAKRCSRAGVPFVLGPINGGLPWPKGYDNVLQKERQLISSVRNLYKYAPYAQSTRREAAAILVASRTTWNEIPPALHHKCFYLPENGVPEKSVATQAKRHPGTPLRVVFAGRLVPLKCVDVTLRGAAPLVREGKVVVDIVGDGPERAYLERVASEEHIADKTTFHGWVQQAETVRILSQGHVLSFPSIREFGGGVVLEAMASGVVPIVVNYGGPGEIVDKSCGFPIPLASSSDTAGRITSILRQLCAEPALYESLSEAALRRIRTSYTWEAKALASLSIYEHLIGAAARPQLELPAESSAAAP